MYILTSRYYIYYMIYKYTSTLNPLDRQKINDDF